MFTQRSVFSSKHNNDIIYRILKTLKHGNTHTHTKLESNSASVSHINMNTQTVCDTQNMA